MGNVAGCVGPRTGVAGRGGRARGRGTGLGEDLGGTGEGLEVALDIGPAVPVEVFAVGLVALPRDDDLSALRLDDCSPLDNGREGGVST